MNKIIFFVWLIVMRIFLSSSLALERPNILFAFADDWGRHASAYAKTDGEGTENDAINTPNFDALSQAGVLFNNALLIIFRQETTMNILVDIKIKLTLIRRI